MSQQVLRVATRRSPLALVQARWVIGELRRLAPGLAFEEVHVTTSGDRIQDRPLSEVGGKGLFLKEIEETLSRGDADLAVHSMKDVPAELAPGLVIGAVPPRHDPADLVLTRDGAGLDALPAGARVGTSSLRRSVQLARRYPALVFVPLRGNIDTRLRRLEERAVDAAILARCGLARLGLLDGLHATPLTEDECIPAVGQGALAIEAREDDPETLALVRGLHDAETGLCVAAERGVMTALEGSCQLPIAAHATLTADALSLLGFVAEPDGSRPRRLARQFPRPVTDAEARAAGLAFGAALRAGG